jgi:hypothetical protein
MKQMLNYLFSWNPELKEHLTSLRRENPGRGPEYQAFVLRVCSILEEHWQSGGMAEDVRVNHMSVSKRSHTEFLPSLELHSSYAVRS